MIQAQIGRAALLDAAARDFAQISEDGALRFRIWETDETWVYVVLADDDTYSVEVGRHHLTRGRLDGAWIRLGYHKGVYCDQLAMVVRSCFLEG